MSTTLRDPIAPATVERIGRLPHVAAASVYRSTVAEIAGGERELAALDPIAGPQVMRFDFVEGGPEALATDLLVERSRRGNAG